MIRCTVSRRTFVTSVMTALCMVGPGGRHACAAKGEPGGVTPASPGWHPDQIIVKFCEAVEPNTRDATVRQHECVILRTCTPANVHLLRIPASRTPEELVADLRTHPCVEYAELNHYVSLYFQPDDPYFGYQWNLYNALTGGINVEQAWDVETGDPNVIVAVLDSGIAYENYGFYRQAPDLAGTRFVPGYDYVNDDSHPNDDNGHGTHVTGTIAQSTNNDLGVAGIAFGCSIMPVKVMDATGLGDYFTITQGIYFAVQNGAKVINLSLGSSSASITLQNAVAFAYHSGVTVVCAAGNDYGSGNLPDYPAAYDAYCMAVGAVRYDNQRADYSNTGSYLDVVAPGGDTLVDQNADGYPDGIVQQTFVLNPTDFGYYFFQGTSMATPHVSGLAALLISHGVVEPDDVRKAIQQTAVDLGPTGWDERYGWGLIDAQTALAHFGTAVPE